MADHATPELVMRGDGIELSMLGSTCQWSLRPRNINDLPRLAEAWGAPLPHEPLSSDSAEGRHALRLGPDEWLLLAGRPGAAARLFELPQDPTFSLVDISSRDVVWRLAGANAARVLAAGCPLDLADAAFPCGHATRTIYAQAEIVLWRPKSEEGWQVRALRSFTDYLSRHFTQSIANL